MNARLFGSIFWVLLFGAPAPAFADVIWDLAIAPTDGVSLAGTFTTDGAGDLLSYDIAVAGGGHDGYLFESARVPLDHVHLLGPQDYEIDAGVANIVLKFAGPISSDQSRVDLSSWSFDYIADRLVSESGSGGYAYQPAQIPEPSSLALLGAALAGLAGAAAFRRHYDKIPA
jgi:hypothetical protein